ncbi:MAG: tRNA (adenosine(37)-N6)-threonylcarbamoyltransferase complex dimerization subunit type 1 TsaB [Gammaproteobacteria bacterium]|nr:tRNA (adenosine(37)-N6)-threonylcarbamoyltransferase complex dimerization subunit type 1 TsaB [Gammaproteobacteria bacterium]MDH3767818.1 tRNA (adenosine(37)-N6)-threonylcarbamoyltransferase complex dimerization subunit type 1 TsaB [Gammaproteobacteria bacterium]
MRFLAIDTATEACSVALYLDGAITEHFEIAPREHASLVLPMADRLLSAAGLTAAELDAIAFGRGPGAFTGVRIAAGVVQGIAYAADLPVVAVSDLAAVALAAARSHGAKRILVCFDARMREVYWGIYESCDAKNTVILQDVERLSAPEQVQTAGNIYAAGSGWSVYPQLTQRFATQLVGTDPELLPHAADIARLAAPQIEAGNTVPAELALPVYLRDEVAWKKT